MKIVMLFPGYGSQFVGMGKDIYDEYRVVQEYFEEASTCLDVNFVQRVFASSDAELSDISAAYTSIFVVSCSLAALLRQEGIEPTIVAGYNSGEYAALWCAGGLSFPDGLYLLAKYAKLYQDLLTTIDATIIKVEGIDRQTLQILCEEQTKLDEHLSIAVHESAKHFYVSGLRVGIERLTTVLEDMKGVRVKSASSALGLHSMLMHPVVNEYRRYMEKVDFKDLKIPFVMAVQAEGIVGGQTVKANMVEAIERSVRLDDTLHAIGDADLIIQVGPGTHLATLVKELYPDKEIFTLNTVADVKKIKEYGVSLITSTEK